MRRGKMMLNIKQLYEWVAVTPSHEVFGVYIRGATHSRVAH